VSTSPRCSSCSTAHVLLIRRPLVLAHRRDPVRAEGRNHTLRAVWAISRGRLEGAGTDKAARCPVVEGLCKVVDRHGCIGRAGRSRAGGRKEEAMTRNLIDALADGLEQREADELIARGTLD
jgi:hypothetical protein